MKYDFIEIGTSNFATCIEKATSNTRGISIEPIKYYLNQLPDKQNVVKLNCAVSMTNEYTRSKVYYVPEHVITKNNLPDWLKGCNSVGDYHFQHKQLNIQHIVVSEEVLCIPLKDIFKLWNVEELDYLKIDTEGADCDILLAYRNNIEVLPHKIEFESNILSDSKKVDLVIQKYEEIGYFVEKRDHDTILKRL